MIRLLLFDLSCRLAPGQQRLRADALDELAKIPRDLRSDIDMSDARLADEVHAAAYARAAARREDEARRLLEILNRIAHKRGFSTLHWQSRDET